MHVDRIAVADARDRTVGDVLRRRVEGRQWQSPPNATEVLQVVLHHGAEPDALCETYGGGRAQTPLCLLVSSVHPATAGVQAALGDVDAVQASLAVATRRPDLDPGLTLEYALIYAAGHDRRDVVALLLEHEPDQPLGLRVRSGFDHRYKGAAPSRR